MAAPRSLSCLPYLRVTMNVLCICKAATDWQAVASLDVENYCCAASQDGQLCSKSIACKNHSMSAKRAVVGRSAPYDMLLPSLPIRNGVRKPSSKVIISVFAVFRNNLKLLTALP
ncbi:SCA7, zinc-binding domain-containing protein [Xylariaceae sp. FL1019]|nr:SCA7, zinc-binding domain-containing protein [Xylariaceae sp. FL1019]